MRMNAFGSTSLTVGVLGLGAGQIGEDRVDLRQAGAVLDALLDVGANLIDTAHCYGHSEERLGQLLGTRRDQVVISSKGGHGIDGVDDWTPESLRACLDESLRRLRTDHIDIYHLHSCEMSPTLRDDLAAVLHEMRDAGKILVPAYSGDNQHLRAAVDSGLFASIETSVSIADQWSLHHVLPDAAARGLGVIAKRPTANSVWRHDQRPVGVYGETYWVRLQALAYDVDLPVDEFALRFSAFAPGVCSAIAGTANPEHVRHNAAIVEKGPLPADVLSHVRERWDAVAHDDAGEWGGEV